MKLIQRIVVVACLIGVASALHAQQICSRFVTESTPAAVFEDNLDGTVTHLSTGLMWKRCAEGYAWDGAASTCTPCTQSVAATATTPAVPGNCKTAAGSLNVMTWSKALQSALQLSPELVKGETSKQPDGFAGYTDWRLPNVRELGSIVEQKCSDPAINSTIFPNTNSTDFWSSTTYVDTSKSDAARYAWGAYFYSGRTDIIAKNENFAVRLVRGGSASVAFDSAGAPAPATPVCKPIAGTPSIDAGKTSVLAANCTNNATSFTWTGGTCSEGTQNGQTCTVSPPRTTTYTVVGTNAVGPSAAATVVVNVAGCTYDFGASSRTIQALAGTQTIDVSTASTCRWSVENKSDWITITKNESGTGNGVVEYSFSTNPTTAVRKGSVTISGLDFSLTQAASPAEPVPDCKFKAGQDGGVVALGSEITLTAVCEPLAASYQWTGGRCAGTTQASCIDKPSVYTVYRVAGVNSLGNSGNLSSAIVTVQGAKAPVCSITATRSTADASTVLKAVCPEATSYGWVGGACGETIGDTCKVAPTAKTDYYVFGANSGGVGPWSAVVTVDAVPLVPVCTLSADPVVLSVGGQAKLTAKCTPAATDYIWSDSVVTVKTEFSNVSPTSTTVYSVVGVNAAGKSSPASTSLYVCNTSPDKVPPSGLSISGTSGNDKLAGGISADTIDGGPGFDSVVYQCNRSSFTIVRTAAGWKVESTAEGADIISNVERIQFGNETLALDISGNAGQAYRLYQAAFNRVPDNGGLKFWIRTMDAGTKLKDVAAGFVISPEFQSLYGSNPTNEQFVVKLYNNVLHRDPDAVGKAYWLDLLDRGQMSKADVLMQFSESPENQAAVIGAILYGIDLLN